MKPFAFAVAAAMLAGSSAPVSATPPQKPAPIHGEGCVEPGAEARCLLVKDFKSRRLYNLLIKGMQPAFGSGIEFSGSPHTGLTACLQGTAVDVQAWSHKDSLKCTQGTTHRK